MATSFMDKLEAQAFRAGLTKGTDEARKWFKNKLKDIKTVNRRQLLKDDIFKTARRTLPGRMYMYFYNPKTKADLPYYDRFPLIFMVEKAKGGFYGLNLHYLPPNLRAILFDKLQVFTNNNKYTDTTKLRMTYKMLNGVTKYKEFKPCFKHYLSSQINSRLVEVPASEWESVLFLPTEYFTKATKTKVWAESRKIIKKR